MKLTWYPPLDNSESYDNYYIKDTDGISYNGSDIIIDFEVASICPVEEYRKAVGNHSIENPMNPDWKESGTCPFCGENEWGLLCSVGICINCGEIS